MSPRQGNDSDTAVSIDGPVSRIVEVAADLFARNGFEGVSMNTIAEAADTSKANVFHHFGSKNELYLAVMEHVCGHTRRLLRELVSDSGEVTERLHHFAHSHLRNLLDQRRTWRLVTREIVDEEPDNERKAIANRAFAENFSMLVRIIEDGQSGGVLRAALNPAMVATLLVGANVFFFLSQDMLAQYPEVDFADDPQRYSHMLMDILTYGIVDPGRQP